MSGSFLSPRIAALQRQLQLGVSSAIEEFWGEVAAQGAPLVEPGPDIWFKPEGDSEPEWLARQFAAAPRRRLRFHLDAGLLEVGEEGNGIPNMLTVTRHLRDVLRAKGYDVQYPIIFAAEGHLMDGTHRIAETYVPGLTELKAVRLPVTPEPDERRPRAVPASGG